jgi:hypothetical protein
MGQYWTTTDEIVLRSDLRKSLPGVAKIVFLHEMIHATASSKRLNRFERLVNNFGSYEEGNLTARMEECIAEIGCMVATMKLGLFNEYSKHIILQGLDTSYTKDMYIPIREIRAAVKYFASDDTSFEDEIENTKLYLEAFMDIKFQDSYSKAEAAS